MLLRPAREEENLSPFAVLTRRRRCRWLRFGTSYLVGGVFHSSRVSTRTAVVRRMKIARLLFAQNTVSEGQRINRMELNGCTWGDKDLRLMWGSRNGITIGHWWLRLCEDEKFWRSNNLTRLSIRTTSGSESTTSNETVGEFRVALGVLGSEPAVAAAWGWIASELFTTFNWWIALGESMDWVDQKLKSNVISSAEESEGRDWPLNEKNLDPRMDLIRKKIRILSKLFFKLSNFSLCATERTIALI